MANGTTIAESGTELRPARPGEERGTATGWLQDLVFTVDHKKLGLMYGAAAMFFFLVGGILALDDADLVGVGAPDFIAVDEALKRLRTSDPFRDGSFNG